MNRTIGSLIALVASTCIALGVVEVVLRVKNSSMQNYDIEMWRYAKELKKQSDNPVLGHEHVPSRAAVLQTVAIRLNEWGLRGDPVLQPTQSRRRILFLGSSITLGWGVTEEDTLTARLHKMLTDAGEDVEVLNAGIGNYNAVRYVELFLTKLTALNPTDIVVHYFLRDAEQLEAGGGNALLRKSQLAATLWMLGAREFSKTSHVSLEDHYKAVYQPSAPGFLAMQAALKRLAHYGAEHRIRLYLAITPDVRELTNYKLEFVHNLMREVAIKDGYVFVDLLPVLRNLPPAQIWSLPGDPHPNALGHQRMAQALFPVLHSMTGLPSPNGASR